MQQERIRHANIVRFMAVPIRELSKASIVADVVPQHSVHARRGLMEDAHEAVEKCLQPWLCSGLAVQLVNGVDAVVRVVSKVQDR